MSDVFGEPDVVLFTGEQALAIGASEQHSIRDAIGSVFGRSREAVETEWRQIVDQARAFVESASDDIGPFALDEVGIKLGFSAEGHVAFIAKGGVEATIELTFKRQALATPSAG